MTRLAAWMAIGVLALAACGGGGDEASQSEESNWANDVCQGADQVTTSISGLTDSLQINPNSSSSALEQAQTEMTDRVNTVQQSISDLTGTITNLPDNTSDAVTSAEDQLSNDASQLNDSVSDLTGAVTKAADATNAQAFTAALAEATSSLASTKDALTSLTNSIGSFLDSSQESLKNAFNDAPACQG